MPCKYGTHFGGREGTEELPRCSLKLQPQTSSVLASLEPIYLISLDFEDVSDCRVCLRSLQLPTPVPSSSHLLIGMGGSISEEKTRKDGVVRSKHSTL